ncbi:response regulator transcription factor [Acetivibrio cellulolyticus]|uniref:response regulator transcription factor n=1 Tax=Acetivibrio cellulolyticus TaxID=35830 RepID=UPI0001E2EC2E|nr:response regulator transcription factor [Acetivibrio cellulolyticus]
MGARILVVDDEKSIRSFIITNLKRNNFEVLEAGTGHEALRLVKFEKPDLVLLDIMLPDMDGFQVCKEISCDYPSLSVIMLTARGQDLDKVRGLELGADDYIIKPFSPMELVARIKAILRRAGKQNSSVEIHIGPFRVDMEAQSIYKNDVLLDFTPREFSLMKVFINNINKAFTRDEILNIVWGEDFVGDPKTVDVHIRRIREKIEDDPSNPKYIETLWGRGYLWRKGE